MRVHVRWMSDKQGGYYADVKKDCYMPVRGHSGACDNACPEWHRGHRKGHFGRGAVRSCGGGVKPRADREDEERPDEREWTVQDCRSAPWNLQCQLFAPGVHPRAARGG